MNWFLRNFFRVALRLVQYAELDSDARIILASLAKVVADVETRQLLDQAKSKYDIASSVRIERHSVFSGNGSISVGDSTYFGERCHVVSHPEGKKIVIGKGCAISHNVHIRTHSYRTDLHFSDARIGEGIAEDIEIGDDVWICANVFIVGGVKVGSNAIIGANSVVTEDIPANAIFAGVPARLIRFKSSVIN